MTFTTQDQSKSKMNILGKNEGLYHLIIAKIYFCYQVIDWSLNSSTNRLNDDLLKILITSMIRFQHSQPSHHKPRDISLYTYLKAIKS